MESGPARRGTLHARGANVRIAQLNTSLSFGSEPSISQKIRSLPWSGIENFVLKSGPFPPIVRSVPKGQKPFDSVTWLA
jgi:hypothetical protein